MSVSDFYSESFTPCGCLVEQTGANKRTHTPPVFAAFCCISLLAMFVDCCSHDCCVYSSIHSAPVFIPHPLYCSVVLYHHYTHNITQPFNLVPRFLNHEPHLDTKCTLEFEIRPGITYTECSSIHSEQLRSTRSVRENASETKKESSPIIQQLMEVSTTASRKSVRPRSNSAFPSQGMISTCGYTNFVQIISTIATHQQPRPLRLASIFLRQT